MVTIELTAAAAERHARLLRRVVVELENVRRLEGLSVAAAIAEMQQTCRLMAEMLDGAAEPLETVAVCVDCDRRLGAYEAASDVREIGGVYVCRDSKRCRALQEAR